MITHPFAADMALNTEGARGVIELLADVFTHPLHLTTARADGGLRFMHPGGTRQISG